MSNFARLISLLVLRIHLCYGVVGSNEDLRTLLSMSKVTVSILWIGVKRVSKV